MGTKRSTWIGGTVFVALLIAAAAWFLAISPAFASASESRDQATSTRDQNQVLVLSLAQLKADFERLPEYKADLATLRDQIPTDAQLPSYIDQLDEAAAANSVRITVYTPSPPTTFVPIVPVVPVAPVVATDTEAAETPAETPAELPADAALDPAAVTPTFMSVPFGLTVVGTSDNTHAFLSDLQRGIPRLFLVSGISTNTLDAAPEGGGRPAVAAGDQELTITGFVYVLPDPLVTE